MSDDPRKPAERSAATSAAAWTLFLVATVVGLAIDLWTKAWAFAALGPNPVVLDRAQVIELTRSGRSLSTLVPDHTPTTLVPHALDLTLVLNRGAVFGLGAGRRWIFVVFTLFAVGFGLWAFAKWTTARDRLVHLMIALVLAGGLGNLYDRLRFACVRDFLHPLPGLKYPFGITTPWSGPEVWPYVSNVADLFLLIGIGGLMLTLMRADKAEGTKAKATTVAK